MTCFHRLYMIISMLHAATCCSFNRLYDALISQISISLMRSSASVYPWGAPLQVLHVDCGDSCEIRSGHNTSRCAFSGCRHPVMPLLSGVHGMVLYLADSLCEPAWCIVCCTASWYEEHGVLDTADGVGTLVWLSMRVHRVESYSHAADLPA